MEEATVEWFGGGLLNAAHNCVDRHISAYGDRPAFVWEGVDANRTRIWTYADLAGQVNAAAAALKAAGIARGDRVILYLPQIPELPVAMLACARIGAIHCAVFPGYSGASLAYRAADCGAKAIITANRGLVCGQPASLLSTVEETLSGLPMVETVFVVQHVDEADALNDAREVWWHDALNNPATDPQVPIEHMRAEDPLFIVYTSGARGKPKGLVHTHAGYLLFAAFSTHVVYNGKPTEPIWHFEETSWITGHTYGVYGPLLNGLTSVICEGFRDGPSLDSVRSLIDRHKVGVFVTLPGTVETMRSASPENPPEAGLSSLRLVGLTEETAKPETCTWLYDHVGDKKCPLVNGYCSSETGGYILASFPAIDRGKMGSCGRPFFGVEPVILDPDTGEEAPHPKQEGVLCIRKPWPAIARTVHGDYERYAESYYGRVPQMFFTGDGAWRDDDWDYWISGRIDDVINATGHRIGIPELEGTLIEHEAVAEAAVVGFPQPVKERGIYAFVHLEDTVNRSDELKEQLIDWVRNKIGVFAEVDIIQWADTLPRTPSGKLLRVVLQKIAAAELEDLADAAAIADPDVVESLVRGRIDLMK
jgi:acetyl-CoA synthetase